jgi:uncharacterized protein YndB with AHSA1/START domain
MNIAVTEHFRCPIDTLFSHIAEPEKQKLWMKGLLLNESTSPGRDGAGSTFRMVIQEGRKAAEYQGEVTAYERPRRLEVRIRGGNLPKGLSMRADYRLSEADGGTRLDYVCACEGKMGFFLRLLMRLFKVFGRMQLRRFLRTLRGLVEAPAKAA